MDDKDIIVVYCITFVITISMIVFGVLGYTAFKNTKEGAAKSFGLLFQRGDFLRIATVIFIVVAAIFLTLEGTLQENGLVGILSGIAGYVLGGLQRTEDTNSKTKKTKSEQGSGGNG